MTFYHNYLEYVRMVDNQRSFQIEEHLEKKINLLDFRKTKKTKTNQVPKYPRHDLVESIDPFLFDRLPAAYIPVYLFEFSLEKKID